MKRAALVPCGSVMVLALALALALAASARAAEPEQGAPPPERRERRGPGPYTPLSFKVVKVDEKTITVRLATPFANEPARPDRVLGIDPEKTRVFVSVVTDERTDEKGRRIVRTKFQPGTLADVKVDQRVKLGTDEDLAVDIIIEPPMPQRPPRPKREADKRAGAKEPKPEQQ